MSQRTFTQGDFDVFVGWDRPLQHFFLVVERHGASDEAKDQGYAFSNLRDMPRDRLGGMTLDEVRGVLKRLDIQPPPTLYDDLERDRLANAGNTRFDYDRGR